MSRYYTGIGSRKTPENVLRFMTAFARMAQDLGYVLRSGGASGADSAFEQGVESEIMKEIYLPWPKFNGHLSQYNTVKSDALEMAAKYHPAWDRCSSPVRKIHARNCYQVLGLELKEPSEFIMCWTPEGKITGGTGQALRIALDFEIPIINLGDPQYKKEFSLAKQKELF